MCLNARYKSNEEHQNFDVFRDVVTAVRLATIWDIYHTEGIKIYAHLGGNWNPSFQQLTSCRTPFQCTVMASVQLSWDINLYDSFPFNPGWGVFVPLSYEFKCSIQIKRGTIKTMICFEMTRLLFGQAIIWAIYHSEGIKLSAYLGGKMKSISSTVNIMSNSFSMYCHGIRAVELGY